MDYCYFTAIKINQSRELMSLRRQYWKLLISPPPTYIATEESIPSKRNSGASGMTPTHWRT